MNDSLYKALTDLKVIAQEKLDEMYRQACTQKADLIKLLLENDLITDENLGKVVSDLVGKPFVQLTKLIIPEKVLRNLPEVVARKQKAVIFAEDKDGLKLAMADPANVDFVNFLAKKTGDKIIVFYATPMDIDLALNLYKSDLRQTIVSSSDISQMVDMLLQYAYTNRASDIHIEPKEEESIVRFRIDGILHDILTIPKNSYGQVVTRIKVMAKLRTDEHMSAQDGKIQTNIEGDKLDIRVSLVPITEGEKVVMRLLSAKNRQFSLVDLGMSETDMAKVNMAVDKPHGMILATGPTGSGKTTTIYALLKILNTRERNIATIEDPVEYEIAGINQIQVNPQTNLTFADGLRAILRQDPNVIFVGEIRDNDTAGIAVNSAMTGHLVVSTLHTNNAATTLPRLLDMSIEPFLVASTVNVIIAQRLVRQICQKCRVSQEVENNDHLKQIFGDSKKKVRVYIGKGCSVCHNTGYAGRVGIFEVLEVTDKIRQLIVAKADADDLTKAAVSEGMTTMFKDGLAKVASGITTLDEVLRTTKT